MNKQRKIWVRLKYSYLPFQVRFALERVISYYRMLHKPYPTASKNDQLASQPLFIISCGRSGTTLMRSMLVAGGQIAIPMETQILHLLPMKFISARRGGWKEQVRTVISSFEIHPNFPLWNTNLANAYQNAIALPDEERSLSRIIDEVYMTYANHAFPQAKIWGDQSPLHTFYLPYIHRIFPNAKYLHMIRDGRDVVTSLVTRFGDGFLFEAVHRWLVSIKRTQQFQRKISPDQYMEVRYEELVRDPENTLKKVCAFIGIDYSPIMLDYWKLPSTVEHKHKSFHVNLGKPIFESSIGKWKDILSPVQQDYVSSKLNRELKKKGYLE